MRGVSVFFFVFTLAFTTGLTSSGNLLLLGVLFSQFILVCFIICNDEKGLLPVLAIHCCCFLFVFSLGLPLCFSNYIVHLRCTSRGGGGGGRGRLLPGRVSVG